MSTVRKIKESLKRDGFRKTFYKGIRFLFSCLPPSSYPGYLFQRILHGYVIREINGLRMFLDLKNDLGISRDLFVYGKREITSTDYLINSNILKEGDAVLDIGANIGYYALIESRLVGEHGIVYALEPVRKNLETLRKNLRLNNVKNIKTYKLAAGDKNGFSFINISKKGNWSSIVHKEDKLFEGREKVKTVTVDEFLKGKSSPKLVRMDVEGYEYAIIKGMENTLGLNPKLMIEIHPPIMSNEQMNSMFGILKEKGYSNALVMYDLPSEWLNSKAKILSIIQKLNKKIGDYEKMGGVELISLDNLFELLVVTEMVVNVIFWK